MEPLVDSWGREIRSLRVSVTDKCNFRCRYCMPAEGLEWLPRDEVLSYEEIALRLQLPEGTVKSRINRGRRELARHLQVLLKGPNEIAHNERRSRRQEASHADD